MPLAEIARRTLECDLSKTARRRLEVIQVSRVSRQCVVTVNAVFSEEFPVRTHRVFLRASHDCHCRFRLVADHIEIFPDRAQIVREAFDVLVKTDEIEIAIALEPRNLLHAGCAALLEIFGVGSLSGLASQRSVQAEYPAMIKTLEGLRTAVLLAANLCTAMRAGV